MSSTARDKGGGANVAEEDAAGIHPHLPRLRRRHAFPAEWRVKEAGGVLSSFFQPTHVLHEHDHHGIFALWTSRRHRKRRTAKYFGSPERSARQVRKPRSLFAPFGYRLFGFAPSNLAWWTAMAFTLGLASTRSISWTLNGVFAMWPLHSQNAETKWIAYTALPGGTLFLIGAYISFLEVLNPPDRVKERVVVQDEEQGVALIMHERQAKDQKGSQMNGDGDARTGITSEAPVNGMKGGKVEVVMRKKRRFRWFGWEPHNFAYVLNLLQLIGATIFEMPSAVTGVPGVLSGDYPPHHYVQWDLLYWLPQCIGAVFFIVNGYLTCVEVQGGWLKVKLKSLEWHIGFWNAFGGVGFFLSGLFGFFEYPAECCQHWGTAFSTFWGSIAFLISSYLLIPEALNP
eukprot:jgi/Chlat1/1121/Chrsp111S00061